MHATVTSVPFFKLSTITCDNFMHLVSITWTNKAMCQTIICTSQYFCHVSIINRRWHQRHVSNIFFFFFFWESFNLWCPFLRSALYHQTKTPISFWCRWGLNPRFLIQPSETLPVKLTGIHVSNNYLYMSICLPCANNK